MYLRLRLKNWRSIDDAEIDFAPFTVIVGKNSSGKSNIVDALLFSNEVGRDAATAVSKRGGIESIRRWGPSKPFDVTIDVRVAQTLESLESDYVRHELVLGSGPDGAWYFKRELIQRLSGGEPVVHFRRDRRSLRDESAPDSEIIEPRVIDETTSAMLFVRQRVHRWGPGSFGREWPVNVRALRPVPELMRQPQPPSETTHLATDAWNVTTVLRRLAKADRGRVVDSMRRIIPGLVDVEAIPAGRYLTLHFEQDQGPDLRPQFVATEMSDGALRALAVIVAASQMKRNELLVIEEPEVNLHPGAADIVYEALHEASTRGAVLVTTHSPELLDRAGQDEILVCEYVDGVTRVGPLDAGQRDLVRKGLFTTAELMRSEDLRREGAEPDVVRDGE